MSLEGPGRRERLRRMRLARQELLVQENEAGLPLADQLNEQLPDPGDERDMAAATRLHAPEQLWLRADRDRAGSEIHVLDEQVGQLADPEPVSGEGREDPRCQSEQASKNAFSWAGVKTCDSSFSASRSRSFSMGKRVNGFSA